MKVTHYNKKTGIGNSTISIKFDITRDYIEGAIEALIYEYNIQLPTKKQIEDCIKTELHNVGKLNAFSSDSIGYNNSFGLLTDDDLEQSKINIKLQRENVISIAKKMYSDFYIDYRN